MDKLHKPSDSEIFSHIATLLLNELCLIPINIRVIVNKGFEINPIIIWRIVYSSILLHCIAQWLLQVMFLSAYRFIVFW
jgi:hypothetical protein